MRADDADQESLTFAVGGLPSAAVLSPGTVYGTALIDWTPTTQDIGTYAASFTVTDSGGQGSVALSDTTTIQLLVKTCRISIFILFPVMTVMGLNFGLKASTRKARPRT